MQITMSPSHQKVEVTLCDGKEGGGDGAKLKCCEILTALLLDSYPDYPVLLHVQYI